MDNDAPAGALMPQQPDPPPWSESGTWLLWGFLSCGLLVGVGFLNIGQRNRRPAWLWCAGFYGAVVVAMFAVVATAPRDGSGSVDESSWQNTAALLLWLVLVCGVVHSLVVHTWQEYRIHVPVPPGARPRPQAAVAHYARRQLWPSRYAAPLPPGQPTYAALSPSGAALPPAVTSPAPVPVPAATAGAPAGAAGAGPGAPPPPATVGTWVRRQLWPSHYTGTPVGSAGRVPPDGTGIARRPWGAGGAAPAPVEPWASFVRSAERARDRFRRSAARVHPGPLREALGELVERVDQSVDECRRIAAGGAVLAEARAGIDTRVVERALAAAEARWGADPGDTLAASTAVALQGQRAAAERLDEVIDDVLDQLRLLDARLGEAVARMLELSARAEAAAAVPELSSGIESLVTDLEALRLAVEETHALEILGSPMTGATAVANPESLDAFVPRAR